MVGLTFGHSCDPDDDPGDSVHVRKAEARPSPASAKRVLMLCYYFPPISSAGTHRSAGFARWLQEFGWHPVVLTVHCSRTRWELSGEQVPPDIEVVRSPEWNLQAVLSLLSGVFNRACDFLGLRRRRSVFHRWCLPDPQIAWLSTFRGVRLARRCDCVYVSCSPFSSALSACLIKLATGMPLVLDFRDPWALNPHANHGPTQQRILRWLETWVVRTCDALILNTPGAEEVYRRQYPTHAHKMTCIPNGFDQLNLPDERAPGDRFVVMHVGDFYRSRQPDRLLEALVAIGNPLIEFVQVGPVFESYARYKDRLSIRIVEAVPHADALDLMRTASLLYLCQGHEAAASDDIVIASKTYEYLATGIPILGECPPGDNADVIRRYALRGSVVTSMNVAEVEAAVRAAYATSRAGSAPEVSPSFISAFNRQRLTRLLAGVLDATVEGRVFRADTAAKLPSHGRGPASAV